ncbi:MAG: helix-turn-helix domain-containing protein, partial [Mycobacterium sp.]
PSDARRPLRAALRLARACGALPIAQRANDELAATGAHLRKIVRGGPDALTSTERRVAALAADGMTTPQIARDLVISPRTVESHLTHIYQKLDIAGRQQLSAALSGDPQAPHAGG